MVPSSDRPGPREKGSAGPGRKPEETFGGELADAGVGQDVPARVLEEGVGVRCEENPYRKAMRVLATVRPRGLDLLDELDEFLSNAELDGFQRETIAELLERVTADVEDLLKRLRTIREKVRA